MAAIPAGTTGSPRWIERTAAAALLLHCGLIAFSTIAFVTLLNGPPGPWLQQEPNATIFRLGWKFSGPTYVVLGAVAAFLFLWGRIGGRRALLIFLTASSIALGSELLGTSTGLPFGEYRYTPLLGYMIGGLVPFPIPVSWFYMIVGSLAITGRLLHPGNDGRTRWRWSLVGGLILVAWDVSMDPAMVGTAHWVWGSGASFAASGLPAPIVAFFTKDIFYGMPLSNWFGWYVTGVAISWLILRITPPAEYAAHISRGSLPIALYAVNGIMPVAICVRDGMWWAATLGALAMAVPVISAIARRPREPQRGEHAGDRESPVGGAAVLGR